MKFKKILIPLIIGCSVGGVTAAVLASGLTKNGDSTNVASASFRGEVANPLQKSTFYLDETIEISPKDIIFDGTRFICNNFYIVYPDGSQKSGANHRLNQIGEYEIVYLANDGDRVIEASEKLYVYQKSYSVVKEASSSEFVDEIICNQKEPSAGIQTYLAEGDVWTYNNAIDVSKANLDQPILRYYTRQNSELAEHMSLDVETTIVRLTDFYDSNNYVDISIRYNDTNPSTHRRQPYALAGCYGQALSGIDLNNKSSRQIVYNGTTYYLHNSNKAWGSCLDTVPGKYGINGTVFDPDIANTDNRGFSIFYNNTDKTIYIKHNTMHLVTDLDEPAIYSNNLFKGFTTGEVILSVRCETYTESLGFFEIDEIYGKKGNDLNSPYAIDEKSPIITLSNEANNFYIANNEPFEIFSASAKDPNLIGNITTQVYYDYGKENQRYVPIVNGTFTPTAIGKYTIVYTAKDTYGNTAVRTVECNAITAQNNKIVSLDFNLPETAPAGTELTLNAPVVNGYNEGLFYRISVFNEDKSDVQLLSSEDLTMFLKRVGKYTVRIEYGDVSTTRIEEFDFESLPTDNAYLEENLFPKYLIKSTSYTLNDNKTVLCDTKDKHYVESEVYIKKDGNAEYESSPVDPKCFYVNASSSVQFKYVYGGKEIYESEVVPVVDTKYDDEIDYCAYFVGDFDKSLEDDGILFTTKENSGTANLEFVNPLSFNLLRFNVAFTDTMPIESFDIIMKDYEGIAEDLVFNFTFTGNVLYVTYNGVRGEIGNANGINLSFDSTRNQISFGTSLVMGVENPFFSDLMYLNIRVNMKAKTSFHISQINNQAFNRYSDSLDYVSPQISYKKLKGQRNINELITIKASVCCDVLSPYLAENHKLMVYYKVDNNSANTFVSATDGTILNGNENPSIDYNVLLDKHGIYIISYVYEDQNFNKTTVSETIYVNDNEDPELTIKGATSSTIDVVSLGKEVEVREYSVKDESETNVSIFAISPMNSLVRIENRKFTPNLKGDWRIVYYAEDAYGNVASASYILRVK